MNVNIFKLLMVFLSSCLLSYLFWTLCGDKVETSLQILLCISGFLTVLITLAGAVAYQYPDEKHAVNSKITSGLFFLIFLIEHVAFALIGVSQSVIIILSGLLLIMYIFAIYGINRTTM